MNAEESFIAVNLGDIADFRNGKALSPEMYSPIGKHPVFGSNGQIARSDEVLCSKSVIVIGRVGAYCGSVHHGPRSSWVTDNAIIAVPKEGNDLRYLYYLLGSLDLQRTAILRRKIVASASRRGIGPPSVSQSERLAAGAEFVVMVCGDIMTMPGLPKVPSANAIDVNDEGKIVGLF